MTTPFSNPSDLNQADIKLAEQIRAACIQAALDGYERASISGLCREGAWEAAISAIRMIDLKSICETAQQG